MSFRSGHVAGFAVVLSMALAGTMLLPRPYREGIDVERTTGRPLSKPWRELADLREIGDLGALKTGLERLRARHGDSPVIRGLLAMIRRELRGPDFDADAAAAAPVEAYFAGVPTTKFADAQAARVQVDLAAGRPVDTRQMLALAARFRGQGRAGSELRWLSRAFANDPGSPAAADGLVALFFAHGRLADAAAIAKRHTADRAGDLSWQRRLAQLGAWLGDPELEVRALECLVALESDPLDRGRLIELYSHLGTPERALPHAVAIADGAAETAAAEEAASTALRAGFVDEGLMMLRRAAARAPVASPWLVRFAELARQDLRLADVREALESASHFDPAAVDAALEDLYRRTDRPVLLADLLQRRLASRPSDERLWNEVITLRAALGQRDAARLVQRQRDAALADPESYVVELPEELRARAGAVRSRALALTLAGTSDGAIVGETLEQLRPFFAQAEFRDLAELLLTKHPGDPRAKAMRRELVDYGRTPLAAEQAAAALAATYPEDVELLRFWLERAQWADTVPAQIAARRRIAALAPGDLDNRYELADLLEFTDDRRGALVEWQLLVDAEGVTSRAVPRLIDTLFALGAEAEAVDWLQRLAEHPRATAAQRLQAADELFYRRSYDRARVLYAAVLAADPSDARALLRMGQIAAWTNDPRRALQFFERRLAASADDEALVRFYLGEMLWTVGEDARARAEHELALAAFEAVREPDMTARSCVATMLARLGETEAAAAAYRDLVARSPRDLDLVLDYADLALQGGDLGLARALAGHAEVLAPRHARTLRLRGAVAARAGDFAAADRAYDEILREIGSDAAVLGEQSELRLAHGAWSLAQASAARWLDVQPDSVAARRTFWDVYQRLADFGVGGARYRKIGSDRMTTVGVGGTWMLDARRFLQGRIAAVSQRGVTALGSGTAETDYTRIDAAFGWRPGRTDRFLVGITAAPGVEGDLPVGVFAAGSFEWREPFRSLRVRLRWNEVLAEPMAAPALGGRQSAIDVASYVDLGGGLWSSLHAGLDRLEIDPDGGPRQSDGRWRGEAAVGYRIVDGDVAVTSPFDPLAVPAGPDSPFLAASPEVTRPWLCNVWLGWQSAHLLGDAALAGPLPLVRDDDYAVGALRVDRHVAHSFGASATGYAGLDTRGGGSVHGVEAALTWRPSLHTELSIGGRYGEALGRSDDSKDQQVHFQVVVRW